MSEFQFIELSLVNNPPNPRAVIIKNRGETVKEWRLHSGTMTLRWEPRLRQISVCYQDESFLMGCASGPSEELKAFWKDGALHVTGDVHEWDRLLCRSGLPAEELRSECEQAYLSREVLES